MINIDGVTQGVLVWIPARGGSKGLPRKALLDLGGKPVIAHTVEYALSCPLVDRVIVDTDDEEIAEAARRHGADVPFLRPASLATDDASPQQALEYMLIRLRKEQNDQSSVIIGMSPTYPFRKPGRLDHALEIAASRSDVVGLCSMTPVSLEEDNLWRLEQGGPSRFEFANPRNAHLAFTKEKYLRLFSLHMTIGCRYQLFFHDRYKRSWPLLLSPVESVDLDDPCDLDLARLVHERNMVERNGPLLSGAGKGLPVLGKRFDVPDTADHPRILRHPDFPLLQEKHVREFERAVAGKSAPAMAGRVLDDDVHPYRWSGLDEYGYTDFVVDVPQEIRGYRQRYPTLHRFIPAMVYLPAGFPLSNISRPCDLDGVGMIPLNREVLLDARDPFDALWIELAKSNPEHKAVGLGHCSALGGVS